MFYRVPLHSFFVWAGFLLFAIVSFASVAHAQKDPTIRTSPLDPITVCATGSSPPAPSKE